MLKLQKEEAPSPFLDSVYCQYRNFMLGIARVYIDDAHLCEDVVHNAFISLIRNQESIRELPPSKLKAYILLAVRHASIDCLRKERKLNVQDVPDEVLMDLLANTGSTESRSPFRNVELYALIRQLSTEDQTVLIGRYVVGLDTNELAGILGCTPGNLRVKLHRASKRALELFTSLGLSLEDFLL